MMQVNCKNNAVAEDPLPARLDPRERGPTGLPLRTVYLCKPGLRLSVRGARFEFREKSAGLIGKLPLIQVRQFIVMSCVTMTKEALETCLECGIPVTFLSMRGGLQGHLLGSRAHDVRARLAQTKAYLEESTRLTVARRIVRAKMGSSIALLRQFAYNHTGRDADDLRAAARSIRDMAARTDAAEGLDELRGFEGAAAREYFRVFGLMLRGPFSFAGRSRRPPRDPVNALLSFGYTLLAQETAATLEAIGLDSYLGFLHAPEPGRPSLALDVIEVLRAKLIDRLAIAGTNLRIFTPDDFRPGTGADGAVLLNAQGRQKFFARYEYLMSLCTSEYDAGQEAIGAPRALFENECTRLKRALIEGRIEDWEPAATRLEERMPDYVT